VEFRPRETPSPWIKTQAVRQRVGECRMGSRGLLTLVRRAMVAILAGVSVAAAIRVRGSGGVPPQKGGWRELKGEDLR
jgi:hypothetical protein